MRDLPSFCATPGRESRGRQVCPQDSSHRRVPRLHDNLKFLDLRSRLKGDKMTYPSQKILGRRIPAFFAFFPLAKLEGMAQVSSPLWSCLHYWLDLLSPKPGLSLRTSGTSSGCTWHLADYEKMTWYYKANSTCRTITWDTWSKTWKHCGTWQPVLQSKPWTRGTSSECQLKMGSSSPQRE